MKLAPALVDTLEAAYQIDGDIRTWLRGVVDASHPVLDQGLGVFASSYDASDPRQVKLSNVVGTGIPLPGWPIIIQHAWAPLVPKSAIERTFMSAPCGTFSELLGESFMDNHAVPRASALVGLADAFSVNAADPTGRGVGLCAPLPARRSTPPAVAEAMAFVGAHLATAARLRRTLGRGARRAAKRTPPAPRSLADVEQTAEAILSPDGNLLHAIEATKGAAERGVLRAAAHAMDRARGKLRRTDPVAALTLWQAMVGGRWSLVDFFDRDGRRFLVAEYADPEPPGVTALTHRERQVVVYAALGHTNKLIGYELGISPSTVSTHLSAAMTKLGARTRLDLARAVRNSRQNTGGRTTAA